jgi:hypothetical protein
VWLRGLLLGDWQTSIRKAGSPASVRRLIHLSEHESRTCEHTRLFELEEQLMPLAGALANPGKDGDSGMSFDRRANEFHDEHGLAHPGAAEHGGLTPLDQRREEVDNFDIGMKNFERRTKSADGS